MIFSKADLQPWNSPKRKGDAESELKPLKDEEREANEEKPSDGRAHDTTPVEDKSKVNGEKL